MELLVLAALIGILPANIAKNKGYSFAQWWIFGTVLFIVALPCALCLREQEEDVEEWTCTECAEVIKFEAKICRWCGADVSELVES
jgi:hypothetical protein